MTKQRAELRWNAVSENHPEQHTWQLLFINRPRRTERYLQRFIETVDGIDDIQTRDKTKIEGTKLEARLIQCITYRTGPHNINWSTIYQGNITRDEELVEKRNDGILEYIKQYLEGSFSS